jgi:DNA-binding MarR family transcriptional regulator
MPMPTELEQAFTKVYDRFKIHFYEEVFRELPDREATLSATEAFAVEVIFSLGEPTIGEFANFIRISLPNATYRVNALVKKGYIQKIPSAEDHREIHLQVTDRFYHYYNISHDYIRQIIQTLGEQVTASESQQFLVMLGRMLSVMDECKEEQP